MIAAIILVLLKTLQLGLRLNYEEEQDNYQIVAYISAYLVNIVLYYFAGVFNWFIK